MPLNWNDEIIPSKADKTTDILGLKEIGGVGQLIYYSFTFRNYTSDLMGETYVSTWSVALNRNQPFLLTIRSM